jgi:hypothetical protein
VSHSGGCQCGAVRYTVTGAPEHCVACHCNDCRKSAGAPFVTWAAFKNTHFAITKGEAQLFNSSGTSMRYFCATCGTGLYFINEEALPGLVDIQSATLDDPAAFPPQAHIQTAERLHWVETMGALPGFPRFPGMD